MTFDTIDGVEIDDNIDTTDEIQHFMVWPPYEEEPQLFETSFNWVVSPKVGYLSLQTSDTLRAVLVHYPFTTAHLRYAPNGKGALMERLKKLEELSNGWVGAGSLAPDPFVVEWLRTHPDLVTTSPNRISVLPLSDGSIALQWTVGDDEFIAEIHSDKTLHLIADRVAADDIEESTIPLAGDPLSAFIATGRVA